MKKTVKLLSLLLALLLLALPLASCANHGKTMIEVGKNEISVNVYLLYLSRMKGELASGGENVTASSYWASIVSLDGKTAEDYYNEQVLEGMRQIAAALYLYDELGLKLDRETEKSIDEYVDVLIEELADGSKAQLNAALSAYGANITTLRDAAILEAKMSQLKAYLYGEDGSLILSSAKEEFYQQYYYRGYQMLVSNTYYKHELDADGNAVYYNKDMTAIAYDTENGILSEGENDRFGNPVYRLPAAEGAEKGKIAYDKKNGSIHYEVDEKGNYISATYTTEEMAARRDALEAIAEDCKGNPARFLEYAETWSDNSEFNDAYAPNGMYFAAGAYTTDAVFGTFALELAKLDEGELAILESGNGYYLIMRVAIDEYAWQNTANAKWFETLSDHCMEYLLEQRCRQYMQFVQVDEELAKSASITAVTANTTY